MFTMEDDRVWDCLRDYWRLEVLWQPRETNHTLVSICGRRRTTEAFGAPLVMDRAALERLNWSFQSAIAVAAGFQATGIRDAPSDFPTRHLLARCYGAFYELDVYGTAAAGNIELVELVLTVPAAGCRPVVHLMDADIEVFAADLAEALEVMSGRCTQVDGSRSPS